VESKSTVSGGIRDSQQKVQVIKPPGKIPLVGEPLGSLHQVSTPTIRSAISKTSGYSSLVVGTARQRKRRLQSKRLRICQVVRCIAKRGGELSGSSMHIGDPDVVEVVITAEKHLEASALH
jgi:hypothetical protein